MATIKAQLEEAYRIASKLSPKCPLQFFGKPSHHDMQASVDGRHEMLLTAAETFSVIRAIEDALGVERLRLMVYYYLEFGEKNSKAFRTWHKKQFGSNPHLAPKDFHFDLQRTRRLWEVKSASR